MPRTRTTFPLKKGSVHAFSTNLDGPPRCTPHDTFAIGAVVGTFIVELFCEDMSCAKRARRFAMKDQDYAEVLSMGLMARHDEFSEAFSEVTGLEPDDVVTWI